MRILVVEDEALVAMTLEDMLLDAGYEVIGPAATARKALKIAELQRPDLALLDINLAGTLAGVALARDLWREWNITSIFLTGQVREARLSTGALGLIQKPYTRETVLDSIEVAKLIIEGAQPPPPMIPRGLELFFGRG